jgi:outer membrane protein insertion porin family
LPRRPRDRGAAGRRALGRAALLLALLSGAGAGAATAAEDTFPTELQTVASVRFEGRRSVPARSLVAVVKTKPPSRLPWRERQRLRGDFLRADTLAIENLYRQHGFLDARARAVVTSRPGDPGRARVTFVIAEGRRSHIRAVELAGNPSYPARDLQRVLHARRGRPFNPAYLLADTLRIAGAYQERGHLARASAIAVRESLAVTVRYEVSEGPRYTVGEVGVSGPGDAVVDGALVRRELLLRRGEVYRRSRVERSLERLYATGLFSQAQITPLPDSARRVIDFELRVRERKPRWFDAGVGSGTSERFRFTGEWGHRNLAGQGLQGVIDSRVAFDGSAKFLLTRTSASLLEPWLLGTRTRGGVSVHFERRDDRADPRWLVEQEGKGVTFQAYRELGRRGRIVLTQDNTFVLQRLRDLDLGLPDSTLDSVRAGVRPSYATHRLNLAAVRDLRDDPLVATRGSAQLVSAEIAGGPLQGASSFSKAQVASSWYTPLPHGMVLALRLRGGVMRPFGEDVAFTPTVDLDPEVARVPLEDRFRIGGVGSVRGFNENELPRSGGLAMAQGNAELRIPVLGPFGVELFVDAGNVWGRPAYVKARHFVPRGGDGRPDPGDLRFVFGVGGTLTLPFGPLRLDLTWSPRPVDATGRWFVAEPQFAIGPAF